MARSTIVVLKDDLTNLTIPEDTDSQVVRITVEYLTPPEGVDTTTPDYEPDYDSYTVSDDDRADGIFEVAPNTAEALVNLASGDLIAFNAGMPKAPRASGASPDSEYVRAWAVAMRPDLGVRNGAGRMGANTWQAWRAAGMPRLTADQYAAQQSSRGGRAQ